MNEHIGQKRKRKDCDGSDELSTILAKFIEVTEECDTKRRLVEAELEEKRREQEQKHEERMMTMMMGFMQRMVGFPPVPSQHHTPTSRSLRHHPISSHQVQISHIPALLHPSLLTTPSPTQIQRFHPPTMITTVAIRVLLIIMTTLIIIQIMFLCLPHILDKCCIIASRISLASVDPVELAAGERVVVFVVDEQSVHSSRQLSP